MLALHTWTLDTTPLADALRATRAAGWDGVELRRIDFARAAEKGQAASDVLALVKASGLGVACVGVEPGWMFADGDERRKLMQAFDESCRWAVALGCQTVMSASDRGRGDLARAASNMREAADIAARHRVKLAVEFNSQAEHLNNLEVMRGVVAKAAHPSCGLLLDTYHLQRSGASLAAIEDVALGEIAYVQYSDVPRDRARAGQGARPAAAGPRQRAVQGDLRAARPEGLSRLHELRSPEPRGVGPPGRRGRARGARRDARAATELTEEIMRKTITGTGGMLLVQTLKDAGVEYLFTNPGSAETGIFAALSEDRTRSSSSASTRASWRRWPTAITAPAARSGSIIAHVMGGSWQLAGQLFNAQIAGLVLARDRRRLGVRASGFPRPGALPGADPGRVDARRSPRTPERPIRSPRTRRRSRWRPRARCARRRRRRRGPCTSPSARSCCCAKGWRPRSARRAGYQIERPGPARPQTVEAIARRLGAAQCPVLMFGDDVWREGAQAPRRCVWPRRSRRRCSPRGRSSRTSRPVTRSTAACIRSSKDFEKVTGFKPDLLFLVGVQGVHGGVAEPYVMQIGPNPVLMGRHYPLDVAAQCELRDTLRSITARPWRA